jgi:aspartate-semialdehyde dehydrogenase
VPPWRPEPKIPVALLGATGMVGQEIARRLVIHPWFELIAVAASDDSAGLRYGAAARGGAGGLDAGLAQRPLVRCEPAEAFAPVVFSALDAAAAREIEPRFARAGALVVSNASAFRMEPDVPLIVPEVNPEQLGLLAAQRGGRGWAGSIICNPNCVAAIVGLVLAPLHRRWGLQAASVVTLQSASGAGYPGVAALDLMGNLIPHIQGEEEKIVAELEKVLGTGGCARVGAQAHRVPVPFGHSAALSLGFEEDVSPESAAAELGSWRGAPEAAGLPSLPEFPIVVTDLPDRPQARLDLWAGNGMAVTVGRLRRDPVLGLRCVVLGHNLIRGAAGGAIANAELAIRSEIASLRSR